MRFGFGKKLSTLCCNLETFGFFTVDESLVVVGDGGNGEEGNEKKKRKEGLRLNWKGEVKMIKEK